MLNYILLGTGIYLCGVSIMNHTKDNMSRFLLKVMPFFIGLFNILMFFYCKDM